MLRVLERAYLVLFIGFWVAWSNSFKELQHWLILLVGNTDHKIISFHSNLSCIFWHKYIIFELNFTFYWIPHSMTHILLSHSQTGVTWVTLTKAHTSDRIKKILLYTNNCGCCCCSVIKSCPPLCDPRDCSMWLERNIFPYGTYFLSTQCSYA